jgi:hypothetical protein
MAEFYGMVQGNRNAVSRLGSQTSGLQTVAASWQGAVVTDLTRKPDGTVHAHVYLKPWYGAGQYATLYDGLVSGVDRDPNVA